MNNPVECSSSNLTEAALLQGKEDTFLEGEVDTAIADDPVAQIKQYGG